MDKRFVLILAVLAVVIGGIFWFSKSKSPTTNSNNGNPKGTSNHTVGKNTEGVTLIEFGDFQCPACGQFFPIVKELKNFYGDKISFRFAHFPLVQIHTNAMAAARAAEAAGQQGKFWEMHDLLYQSQTSWSSSSNAAQVFEQYATSLGLDMDKFKADVASAAVLATVNADVAEAQSYGGSGTPTFVLNGKKIDNPTTLDEFKKVIDQAIADAKNKQ